MPNTISQENNMLRRILPMILILALRAAPLCAATIVIPPGEFKKASQELGGAVAYRNETYRE